MKEIIRQSLQRSGLSVRYSGKTRTMYVSGKGMRQANSAIRMTREKHNPLFNIEFQM